MGMSVSAAAVKFDKSTRTANDVREFANADPTGAAAWLAEIASTAPNAPAALKPLADAFKAGHSGDALTKLLGELPATAFDDVAGAVETAKAQTAGAVTLGWSTASEAPTFVGHLDKGADGVVRFKTNTQTFDVDLSKTSWREELETAFMRDLAGNPQVMTIKGAPSADGKRLFALEFAPGVTREFVSGRVAIEGTNVFITLGERKLPVTDETFANLLRGDATRGLVDYSPVGLILPMKPGRNAEGNPVIDRKPDGFFILGRLMKMNVGTTPDGNVIHEADTGYFRGTAVLATPDLKVPPQSAPGGPVFDANDMTKGSTNPGQGPRAFFYARILPHEFEIPAGTAMSKAVQRKLQIVAVSDQADNGIHSPTGTVAASVDFGSLATHVPASAPEHTAAQGTIDPND